MPPNSGFLSLSNRWPAPVQDMRAGNPSLSPPEQLMAKLFVSYARRDGESLARRLETDLCAAGHEPWRDKPEVEAGESWSHEIEDAINACEALLAVLTAGSYESSICRGEQLRALRIGKRIIPLLAQIDADRPLYLEGAHYLDFSDNVTYPAHFSELLYHLARKAGHSLAQLTPKARKALDADAALGAPMSAMVAGSADWAGLRGRAHTQLERFRDTLAGRGSAAGMYEPALYIERTAEEAELGRFAEGSTLALVLVGDPGVGKTNLLAHWADEREAAGDGLLVYPGERLDAQRLPGEIARDLGYEDGPALDAAWERLDALAQDAGRLFWIIVDGLNEVRSGRDGARQLMLTIDSLVSRLPGAALRVVVSCTQAAWQRMERQEPLRLAWRRYHRTREEADALLLERFTAEQAEAAYARYAARFALPLDFADLPRAFCTRLREPVLLRLLAETLQGRTPPEPSADFDTLVFRRYFEERIASRDEQVLVDALAAEMLAQRSAALALQPLLRHPTLGPMLADESPDSAASRLLDDGVLSEMRGDLFDDDRLRFTYPQIGAYAIVRTLLRRPPVAVAQTARELAAAADDLPLAWEAAITLLTLRGDTATYAGLAGDPDPELRELALESLVRHHGSDPARAREVLTALFESDSPEQQRTALRAAFNIGPAVRDLLVHAALGTSENLRHAVRDTLYFIWNGISRLDGETRPTALYFVWRHAPDFTRALMNEMIDRVSWLHPIEASRILSFVLDLTITIYVNHCERADVIEQTAVLFRALTVDRLHLDRLTLGATFDRIVFRVVSSVFADRLLRWMLVDDEADPARFFERPSGERAALTQAAAWLDPQSDLEAARPALQAMFGSGITVVRGAAALVLAVHALAQPERTEPVARGMFDALDSRGRAWLLVAFSVLLPTTPSAWLPMLESFHTSLIDDPTVEPAAAALPARIDASFVPLGLAYGKRGWEMPLFEPVVDAAKQQPQRTCRLLNALGVVGFYYPRPVLTLLGPRLQALLGDPATAPATMAALATIRVLHFEPVDSVLLRSDVDEAHRRDVTALADPARVQQFMRFLGYYNNAVHYCVHYPRMRRGLAAFALERLAGVASASEFVAAYAQQAIGMARDADFDLRRWTLPDAPADR